MSVVISKCLIMQYVSRLIVQFQWHTRLYINLICMHARVYVLYGLEILWQLEKLINYTNTKMSFSLQVWCSCMLFCLIKKQSYQLSIPWTINESHLPYKTGLDVMQSHSLCRTRFGQYQASSAALGPCMPLPSAWIPSTIHIASHDNKQLYSQLASHIACMLILQ